MSMKTGTAAVKSGTGLTGSGLRDWIVQRVSAVILAVYLVVILGWVLMNAPLEFTSWQGFMLSAPMKVLNLLALLALVAHAWVGMWTVFTDYITKGSMGAVANPVRMVLQTLTIVGLIAYLLWGILIFWA